MRGHVIVIAAAIVIALLAGATAASAARGKPLYRTQRQAEHYLVNRLEHWGHLDLRSAYLKAAFCANGRYSQREQRSGKHFRQGLVNRRGVPLFRSFACTLSLHLKVPRVKDADVYGPRVLYLYLVATRTGWRVRAD